MFSPAKFVSVSRGNLQRRREMHILDEELTIQKERANSVRTAPGPLPASRLQLPASRIQSSHPDIESHANPMKTIAKTFFNRHTFAILVSTRHTPLISNFSQPLSPMDSEFPIRKPSHARGRRPRKPLKTDTDKISTRQTHHILRLPNGCRAGFSNPAKKEDRIEIVPFAPLHPRNVLCLPAFGLRFHLAPTFFVIRDIPEPDSGLTS
jgi:hypothetical protein